jgi:SAM-dependent methyltransferase
MNVDLERLAPGEAASLLSDMTALSKKKAGREELDALLGNRETVLALLNSELPKERKNAARLLGALGHEEDVSGLSAALMEEKTLFVVPSLLLALGNIGGAAAEAALLGYEAPSASSPEEDKHCEEIRLALKKARDAAAPQRPLGEPYRLLKKRLVLITAPPGFSALLEEEAAEAGLAASLDPQGVRVETDQLAPCLSLRCGEEVLVPLGTKVPFTPEAVADRVKGELTLPYRIELRNESGDRGEWIRALVQAVGGDNSPSRYGLELRVMAKGKVCDLFLKPCFREDARFAYRKKALPASIAPPLAACIARLCRAHLSGEAAPRVLDPFCGSGTLLTECEKLFPCRALIGVDCSPAAVAAARENGRAAGSKGVFVQKDILRFVPREPFDLVVSNMPFGNRVGSHENNERLYEGFAKKLPSLVDKGGVAVLYTMEYRLLSAVLRKAPGMRVENTLRTSAGGLNPWVFVITRDK